MSKNIVNRLRGQISELDRAAREDEMSGCKDPGEARYLEEHYQRMKDNVLATLRELDIRLKS